MKLMKVIIYTAVIFSFCILNEPCYALPNSEIKTYKTSEGIFTDYGEKFKSLSTYAGVFDVSSTGDRLYYGITRTVGECQLFKYNISRNVIERIVTIPKVEGAWSVVKDKNYIYIGTYNSARLFRYNISDDTIKEVLNIPESSAAYIWDMVMYNNRIYMGTYPKSILYEYDTETGKSRNLGSLSKDMYIRSMEAFDGKIYAGTGARAGLIEYDISTGTKKDILIKEFKNDSFVYDLKREGNILFMGLRPSNRVAAYNLQTGGTRLYIDDLSKEKAKINPDFSSGVQHFAGFNGSIFEYNSKKDELYSLYNDATYKSQIVDNKFIEGINEAGLYRQYDFSGNLIKESDFLEEGLRGITTTPMSIAANNDIVVLGEKRIGVFDVNRDVISYKVVEGEVKAMCFTPGGLYTANYIGARVWNYNTLLVENPALDNFYDRGKFNIFNIENLQNRPYTISSKDGDIVIGTEPEYGNYGGALTYYSKSKNIRYTVRDVVKGHSIYSTEFDKEDSNIVYIGTSATGGTGTLSLKESGHVVKWDLSGRKTLWDIIPDNKSAVILSLAYYENKLYCTTLGGSILEIDPADGKIRSRTKGTFIKIITSVDGNLYAISRTGFYKINADNMSFKCIKNDFKQLTYEITEDKQNGKIYFIDGDSLWSYQAGVNKR